MRTPGVEPGSQAWEACMIPLHYVRRCCRHTCSAMRAQASSMAIGFPTRGFLTRHQTSNLIFPHTVSFLSWLKRTANNRKVRGSSPRGTTVEGCWGLACDSRARRERERERERESKNKKLGMKIIYVFCWLEVIKRDHDSIVYNI